jgi:hypothetical protein
MKIAYRNLDGAKTFIPAEANAILPVDPDLVLPAMSSMKGLEAPSWRKATEMMERVRIYDPVDHRGSLIVKVERKCTPSGLTGCSIPDETRRLITEPLRFSHYSLSSDS